MMAQDPIYWQLTDEEGLPSMTVYEMAQDSLGYIWLATENGICRYDGQVVKTFKDSILKDNEILDLQIDQWNRIWFKNLSGQIAYIENDKIVPLYLDSLLAGKFIDQFQVGANNLWALHFLEKKALDITIYQYDIKKEAVTPRKTSIKTMIPGDFFYFKNDTLAYWNFSNKKINQTLYFPDQQEVSVSIFQKDIEPYYYKRPVLSHNDFVILPFREKKLKLHAISPKKKFTIDELDIETKVNNIQLIDNTLWILTERGIQYLTINDQMEITYTSPRFLNDLNTHYIMKDQEDNYWVSTQGRGILIIPSLNMFLLNSNQSKIPDDKAYCLYHDVENELLLCGHKDGNISIHKKDGSIRSEKFNLRGMIRKIIKTDEGNYAIISDDHLGFIDKDLKKIIKKINSGGPKTILEDSKLRFWIGLSTRTIYSDVDISSTKTYNIVIPQRTYALLEDAHQRIWIGTTQGIYYYKDSLFTYQENGIHTPYSVTDFVEANDSVLWVSTKANGVIGIKNQETIYHYNTDNGLSSNTCQKLFWQEGLLWMATNGGLDCLNPKTNEIRTINKYHGLYTNEINDIAIIEDTVWLATLKGLVNFPKSKIYQKPSAPPIYINTLKIWEKPYPLAVFNQLKHDQNNIQIDFKGLSYKAKNAISYKYKLSGVDQDWIHTKTPYARYPVLNPGLYTFEVYAINQKQVQSLTPASIQIKINEAWWQLWWIQGLLLLCLMSALLYYFQDRNQKAEAKRNIQNQINQLQQQALQAQMNPHFIFNALSAIQKSLTTNDQEEAMLYLSQFAKLIRSIFEYSKQSEISLEEEISFLKLYLHLEKLRFKNRIKIELTIDPILDDHLFETKIPPLLLQPLVENALKHGLFHKEGNGLLKINFSKQQQYLCFSIEDNGVGREEAKSLKKDNWHKMQHKSSGFDIIQKRLNIINKNQHPEPLKIEDLYQDKKATGTRIITYILCQNFN